MAWAVREDWAAKAKHEKMSIPFADSPCSAHIRAIHRISSALFAKTDMDQVLRETLEVSLQITNADAGSILLYVPEQQQLVFRYAVGSVAHKLIGLPLPLTSKGKCATVFNTGRSDISVGGFDPQFDSVTEYSTKSTLTTPIRNFSDQPIGVIQVLNKLEPPNLFDDHDQELLEVVSALAATVIANARQAELEKQAVLAHADAEKQAALARVLGFIGHQLKNQAAIIEEARQTFDIPITQEIQALQAQHAPGADQLAQDFAELDTMLQSAAAKVIQQARVINEYGQRQDLFQFQPNDLKAILTAELTQLAELAAKYGTRLDLSEMEPVPAFPCEAFFVSQAVFNLVHNAFQAMRAGQKGDTVRVRLACTADGTFPEGHYAEISVEDNGPGMPPETLAAILRGEAGSSKHGGTGVGTRLVRDVVLTHGGTFTGESMPGVGTTFLLRLPLSR